MVQRRYSVSIDEHWVPSGQWARTAGHDIPGGLLYLGRHLRSATGGIEPALINPDLPVAPSASAFVDPDLRAPAYHLISPHARGTYLEWLAGGRFSEVPISLVLLFLFGLERRVLSEPGHDAVARQELTAITSEARRLRTRYGDAGSAFLDTMDRFLDLLRLLAAPRITFGDKTGRALSPAPPAPSDGFARTPMSVRVALAGFAATATPVPADWARTWAGHHPSLRPRTVQTRCPDEFDRLFALRYVDRCGAGLVTTDEVPGIRLRYQPASPGMTTTLVCREDLPDVLTEPRSTRLLGGLIDDVVASLNPYSRWLARFPEGRGSLAEAPLLPTELLDRDHGRLGALRAWAEAHLDDRSLAIIDAAEFGAFWATATPHRMARDEAAALIEVLALLGVGIEPDVRFGAPSLTPGPAVLFRDPAVAERPEAGFGAAATIIRCAAAVASAVGPVDPEGAVGTAVLATVSELAIPLRLAPRDALRLAARLGWLLAIGVNIDRLARQTALLGPAERDVAGRYLISIAAVVDPPVGPAVVGLLTRLYRMLGLHQDLLFSRLHESTVAGPSVGWSTTTIESPPPDGLDEPVVVRRSEASAGGYPLPWAADSPPVAPGGVRLDQSAIERKIAETAAVTTLLESIFEDEAPPTTGPALPDGGTTRIAGLDPAHSLLLHRISTRQTWTRQEFTALAQAHGVLPDGALDLLNEVALDTVGAPVIEDDTILVVHEDIAQELLG